MILNAPLSSDEAAALALWKFVACTRISQWLDGRGRSAGSRATEKSPIDVLFPVGTKPLEIILNLPFDALIQRPRRVAAAQAAYDQLAESLIQNGLNTIRDARFAHADLVLAAARVDVADRAATLRTRIAQITGARLRAGDISELETVQARTEAGTAQEQARMLPT